MERQATAAAAGMLVVALLCVQCLGCGMFSRSEGALLTRVRTGATARERHAALLALKGRVQPWMREDLQAVLAHELDASTRALAAQMLGELGDPAAADELRLSVRQAEPWIVRGRALQALAVLLGPRVDEDLRYVLENEPDKQVRVAAVELACTHLPRDAATAFLLDALEDRSPAVRLKAGLLLHELTGRSAPPERQSWQEALELE